MYNGPERKYLRLKEYDYSSNGFYFVTICTKNRKNHFGEIIDGKMVLNEYGKVAEEEISKTEKLRNEIKIDLFVVMPNHIHLLIVIENQNNVGCDCIAPNNITKNIETIDKTIIGTMQSFPTRGCLGLKGNNLSSIIRGLKGIITKQINSIQEDFIFSWQKSFFDVIIKNDEQLNKTRQYILENPLKWEFDKNNPVNIK